MFGWLLFGVGCILIGLVMATADGPQTLNVQQTGIILTGLLICAIGLATTEIVDALREE